ncbi:nicotinamide-nucleotide amidase [Alteromonadaceae bacterium BrNp21-10]|nr:nicotinamide-nucleotide amidase [Alteromonadaceae bacterium BrNp21-10]
MALSEQTQQLAQHLGELLANHGWQISCAESCTGGGIGYAITSVSGSSAWFEKGFLTYSNAAKSDLLGVQASTLIEHGAVSSQVVEQMAKGAAKNANADIAISVSGIAGPDGGSAEKPVGTVWFGMYFANKISSVKQCFKGDRHQVREQAINFALNYCIKTMQTL